MSRAAATGTGAGPSRRALATAGLLGLVLVLGGLALEASRAEGGSPGWLASAWRALTGQSQQAWPGPAPQAPAAARAEALGAAHGSAPQVDAAGHASTAREREVRERFEQAVVMLHAKQYEPAIVALQRVLVLAPRLPEAHVNLGFAYLGFGQPVEAREAFEQAIEHRAEQANAYYGLALAAEALGDRAVARGAMRSYLHLSPADAPHRHKARAALWEWEQDGQAAAPAPPPSVVRIAPR
jgi:Tfp pilus assembly protein PilF